MIVTPPSASSFGRPKQGATRSLAPYALGIVQAETTLHEISPVELHLKDEISRHKLATLEHRHEAGACEGSDPADNVNEPSPLVSRVRATLARHRQEALECPFRNWRPDLPEENESDLRPRDAARIEHLGRQLDASVIENEQDLVEVKDVDLPKGAHHVDDELSKIPKITARSRARRRVDRSRKSVGILPGYVKDARAMIRADREGGCLSSAPPLSIARRSTSPRTSSPRSRERAPAWRYTTEIEQIACYNRTVSSLPLAFTLNLGAKILDAANDNPKTVKHVIHDRVAKALIASPLGPREFWFALECSPTERLHLHGGIDATENERALVEIALAKAGGDWSHENPRQRQVHTVVQFSPDGWARYADKSRVTTKKLLGIKNTVSVTNGCRARAEALWEASRVTAKAAA